jgi:protocatechuate 3,4-dioxygenase beta subunit
MIVRGSENASMSPRQFAAVLAVVFAVIIAVVLWILFLPMMTVVEPSAPETKVAVGTADAADRAAKKSAKPEASSKWERVGPGTVVGVVREYGSEKPIDGVEVTLEAGLPGPNELLRATTGADGGFAFDKVTNFDAWTLRVKAPAPLADAEMAGVVVVENRQTNLGAVYLAPAFGVPGVVVDEKDAPVPGATIRAVRARTAGATIDLLRLIRELSSRSIAVDAATSGEDGRFELRKVPPGNYDFTVEKPGFQIRVEQGAVITPDAKSRPLRFVLQRGFPLAGTVKREHGEPVAGVAVVAFHEPREPTDFNPLDKSFATTDAGGAFHFDGLGTGRYVVAVTPDGEPAVAERNVAMPAQKPVDIVLKGDCSLEGKVTAESDKPVAGAQVYVMIGLNSGNSPTVGNVTTGADGRYEFRGLSSGPVQIFLVRSEGYGNYPDDPVSGLFTGRDADLKLVPGKNVKDVKLAKGGIVRGVVKEKGGDAPIAGVRVELTTPLAVLGGKRGATTDADGKFEITSVPKGAAILMATKDGWYQPGVTPQSVMMILGARIQGAGAAKDSGKGATIVVSEPGEVIERTLELARGSSLEGVVTTPDGAVLAGARVSLAMEESGNYLARAFGGLFPTPEPRLTDAQGHYDLPGPPPGQKARVVARATGYLDGKSDVFSCGVGEAKSGVDVKLRLGATLTGKVHDEEGKPVEGALVRWIAIGEDEDVWSLRWRLRSATPTVADAKGEFRIPNVDTGKLAVEATETSHLAWESEAITGEEGKPTQIDATLKLGAAITGRVVSSDGRAKSGATIECSRVDDDGADVFSFDDGTPRATSDSGGEFRIEGLGAGRYRVEATAAGAAPSGPQTVEAGGPAVTLQLAEAFSISGTLRAKGGGDVADVSVELIRRTTVPNPAGGDPVEQTNQVGRVKTTAAGEFEFRDIAGGAYDVKVSVGWGPPPRPNVAPTTVANVQAGKQGLVIDVESGLTISGTVYGEDGEPAVDGWAVGQSVDRSPPVSTDWVQVAGGRLEITGLLPSRYRITIYCGNARRDVVADAGAKDVRVDFGGAVRIRAHVLKADGTPAVGLGVEATGDQGGGAASTDAEGRCEIKGLPDGTYVVQTHQSQDDVTYVASQKDVQVRAGAAAEVELRLAKRE